MSDRTEKLRWQQICAQENYVGRWLALDECEYEPKAGADKVREGLVVDSDRDLASLCERLQREEATKYAIVFCPVTQ